MLDGLVQLLAQSGPAVGEGRPPYRPPTDDVGGWVLVVLALIAGLIWLSVFLVKERRERRAAELRAQQLGQSMQAAAQDQQTQRESTMYAQHQRMNDLQIQKLAAEVELLQAQIKTNDEVPDRIEASKEAHELMVEKTKLEIDALRLQIAEHRRRLSDDWRSDP